MGGGAIRTRVPSFRGVEREHENCVYPSNISSKHRINQTVAWGEKALQRKESSDLLYIGNMDVDTAPTQVHKLSVTTG